MIEKILKVHPIFNFAEELSALCKPLNLLNINYFSHVKIDSQKRFTAIANNPQFAEHYFKNNYFNADIHMAKKNLGNNILWDFMELGRQSQKMHTEAAQFGIRHTFTMLQNNVDGSKDYYHFASKVPHCSINQIYLAHLDLLKIFLVQFHEKVLESKHLSYAYKLKLTPTDNTAKFSNKIITSDIKSEFLKNLSLKNAAGCTFIFDAELSQLLTLREQECLYFYVHGKSPREISSILFLSHRTIEQYLQNIKIKLNVINKSELIEKALHRFYSIPSIHSMND